MKKLISYNCNSITKRLPLIKKLLEEEDPDLLFLQETRINYELFPYKEFSRYKVEVNGLSGRNGTGIISKIDFELIYKDEDRSILIRINDIYIFNIYTPSGMSNLSNKEVKLKYLDKIKSLINYDRVIIGGDFNVIIRKEESGNGINPFSIEEQEAIKLEKFEDISLKFNTYLTWWDYRDTYFKNGLGLDRFLIKNIGINKIKVLGSYRSYENPSDHVPIIIEYY